MNMNNLCLVISGLLGFTAVCGLEGGAFNCSQTLMVMVPCILLFLQSADKKEKALTERQLRKGQRTKNPYVL